MSEIIVGLGDRSYPIIVESGCIRNIGRWLSESAIANKYCIIADDRVAELYGDVLAQALAEAGIVYSLVTFPHGEASKSLATLAVLAGQLTRLGFDRKDGIIGFGGGVTGDLAGFLAATYMRGINFIQVPTTLLSQVDSSVGGKTGVDIPEGKNLIGSFYQPKAVFIDLQLLKSLPHEELLGGMGEVIKYGVIRDRLFFNFLAENREKILALDETLVEKMILTCCRIKADVVAEDEREGGVRRILNFGHTLGHAVESASNFSIIHGLAVSIGMVAATRLSVLSGYLASEDAQLIVNTLLAYGLPTEIPSHLDRTTIKNYLSADKKVVDGKVHYVLPVNIGKTKIVANMPEEYLDKVLGLSSLKFN